MNSVFIKKVKEKDVNIIINFINLTFVNFFTSKNAFIAAITERKRRVNIFIIFFKMNYKYFIIKKTVLIKKKRYE